MTTRRWPSRSTSRARCSRSAATRRRSGQRRPPRPLHPQSRPDRRGAVVADAVRRAETVGAVHVVDTLAQRNIEEVRRGTRERRGAERLYRRVMTGRAYRLAAARQLDGARAAFDADCRARRGRTRPSSGRSTCVSRPANAPRTSRRTTKPGTAPALSHFAKAYLLARQLPKLDGEEHAKAAAEAIAALHSSWSDLKGKRIAQALYGALLHEEYLRDRGSGVGREGQCPLPHRARARRATRASAR